MRIAYLTVLAGLFCAATLPACADTFTLTGGGNTFSFTLPAAPTPDGLGGFGSAFYFDSVPVTVNGVTSSQAVDFYAASSLGGLSIEDPGQGSLDDTGTGLLLDQVGSQLFSGGLTAPTFSPGTYGLTNEANPGALFSDNYTLTITATPEPSSLILLGTGVAGLAGAMRRRFASQR